jgi:hypothetical protein
MSVLQARNVLENSFLDYIASRINWEVGRFRLAEQTEAETGAHISALADLALEVLGSRSEVEAWLQMVTEAPERPKRTRSRGQRGTEGCASGYKGAENNRFLEIFQQKSR